MAVMQSDPRLPCCLLRSKSKFVSFVLLFDDDIKQQVVLAAEEVKKNEVKPVDSKPVVVVIPVEKTVEKTTAEIVKSPADKNVAAAAATATAEKDPVAVANPSAGTPAAPAAVAAPAAAASAAVAPAAVKSKAPAKVAENRVAVIEAVEGEE